MPKYVHKAEYNPWEIGLSINTLRLTKVVSTFVQINGPVAMSKEPNYTKNQAKILNLLYFGSVGESFSSFLNRLLNQISIHLRVVCTLPQVRETFGHLIINLAGPTFF